MRQIITYKYYVPEAFEQFVDGVNDFFNYFGTSQTIEFNQIEIIKFPNQEKKQFPSNLPENFKD